MGKLMRSHIVRSLRQNPGPPVSMQAHSLEVNICCNGREAADEVGFLSSLALMCMCAPYVSCPS